MNDKNEKLISESLLIYIYIYIKERFIGCGPRDPSLISSSFSPFITIENLHHIGVQHMNL